jgi:hypothetical protein
MTLSLHPRLSREQLPIDAACDLDVTLVLRNDGTQPLTIYPNAAKLSAIVSYAGIGISWMIELADVGGTRLPFQELRRWYGPPGNPPAPSWANEHALKLAPGDAHSSSVALCWLPNVVLEPRHLDPKTIDPEKMDRVAPPPDTSVLVVNGRVAALDRKNDDFLRGHVVGFVPKPGEYALRFAYSQSTWGNNVNNLASNVAPVKFEIG